MFQMFLCFLFRVNCVCLIRWHNEKVDVSYQSYAISYRQSLLTYILSPCRWYDTEAFFSASSYLAWNLSYHS